MIAKIKQLKTITFAPLLVGAMLGLGACSANPATGEQSFTAFMSPEREKEVGREEHPKILKAFGGAYEDPEIGAYIATVGARLSQHSEMPGLVWTFTVLNDSKVNAFALPGGYVYITRGLLAMAGNEAEVAGVLSHEIGHVTARHTAQRYSTTVATSLGLQVLGAVGSAVGVPSVAGDAVALGAQAALQGYSRDQEFQSDMLGVRYMTRAGYDPDAMTSFFTKLRAHQRIEGLMEGNPDAGEQSNIMSTHPRTADRIEQAIKLSSEAQNGMAEGKKKLNASEYLSKIDGMIFGDDISQGIIRGNTFVHPDLAIRFDVPDGFRLFNSPANVVAKKNEEAAIVFDMADAKEVNQASTLKNYITTYWAKDLYVTGIENININGMNAVTGVSEINTKQGRRDIRVVAIQDAKGPVYRLLFITDRNKTTELNLPLRNTTYSFRKLTETEVKNIKPYHIKLYQVRADDTPSSLAEMLKVSEFKAEWMEALNAIKSDSKLIAGTTIKLISE